MSYRRINIPHICITDNNYYDVQMVVFYDIINAVSNNIFVNHIIIMDATKIILNIRKKSELPANLQTHCDSLFPGFTVKSN